MSVRLWAGLASVVFACLLAWVVYVSFGPPGLVVPTVGVRPEKAAGSNDEARKQAVTALSERTRLQSEALVADGKNALTIENEGTRLAMKPDDENGPGLVRGWVQEMPHDSKTFLQTPVFRTGVASLPYRETNVLVQPQGRDFRRNHNDRLRYGGGWLIFGTCLALALFLLARGRIKTVEGESRDKVLRFEAAERANHWMTASAFLIMGLTGLIILYGKPLLLPIIGAGPFSWLAWISAWTHMASAVPFVIGIVLMIFFWVGGNLPEKLDWQWLKRGGGFLRDDGNNPPARRFNAGQKIVFWATVLGGLAMLATGLSLMFPFYAFGYTGMQWAQLAHAGIGLALIALILGHIYIGTVGMEGAFHAMWSGLVSRTWAKEHHSLWFETLSRRRR